MGCPHIATTKLNPPSAYSVVHKEECTQCFDSQDGPNGIDVCLSCFNAGCLKNDRNHAMGHYNKSKHPFVVNIRRTQKPKRDGENGPPQKVTKLAIAAESDADKYEYHTTTKCYACGDIEIDRNQSNINLIVDSILAAMSASRQNEVKAWELDVKPCEHTLTLVQDAPKKLTDLAQCNDCDLKQNLWLCLTCGNLGCGRQQFGGLGGNSHGLAHYEKSKHPVSCKLGTITPEGTADIYCYICNDEKEDPDLAKHLSNFGINVAEQQKTEKSLMEMQVEHNMKFDFSMTTEDGHKLESLYGPGLTGLKNLGNSCYMASVLQSVFHIPEIRDRYFQAVKSHQSSCSNTNPASCFQCQMTKLADGLISGRYAVKSPYGDEQEGVTPAMFKSLIGKDHHEFSTMRQQDASEFLEYFLSKIEEQERSQKRLDPTHIFACKLSSRIECSECHKVKYKVIDHSGPISVTIPEGKREEAKKWENQKEGKDEKCPVSVSLKECLDETFAKPAVIEYKCPSCNKNVHASKTTGFMTFPKVLVLQVFRFVIENYVPRKSNIRVTVPSDVPLDLSAYKAREQSPDEVLLPEDDDTGDSSEPQWDQSALDQLLGMGFPEVRCKKALFVTGNSGAEVAMNWLFEHMDDADIDVPMDFSGGQKKGSQGGESGGASEAEIGMLMDMGFSKGQAVRALKENGNNVERAIEYLFTHGDSLMDEDSGVSSGGAGSGAGEAVRSDVGLEGGKRAEYGLTSFINHKGPSVHCGHYVAHVREGDGDGKGGKGWVLMNDHRVVRQTREGAGEMMSEAYVLVFRRV